VPSGGEPRQQFLCEFVGAGTARAPRPNVTDVSDSSIEIGAAPLGMGIPANSATGCMRIMKQSACKRDASKTCVSNQRFCEKPRTRADSIWAIAP